MTRETPVEGVVIVQPARGFRYAADAFWLAGFALEGGIPRTAVDLGTGSGIIALLLARQGVEAVGFDHHARWAECWSQTLAESSVRCELVPCDVRDWRRGGFDLAVSNPPYHPPGTGPVSPDPDRARARTESTAPLAVFLQVGCASATRMCVVVPRAREEEVLVVARALGRDVTRWARVGAKRSLLELAEGRGIGLGGASAGEGRGVSPLEVAESSPETARWYALATATLAAPPQRR